MTRRIRLDLAYDGTDFSGWQVQARRKTVQAILDATLTRLNGGRLVAVRGAGRTDAGVHARHQVCDFLFDGTTADIDLAHALHCLLPATIRPLALVTVDAAFHSRMLASSKEYRYRLDRSRYGDPALTRFASHAPWPLDEPAIERAVTQLPGRHDWTGFTASKCEVVDRVRTVTRIEFRAPDLFVFEGEGFLTHMVRILAGTFIAVGRGKMSSEQVGEILTTCDRRLAGPTAEAQGLHLWRVNYPGDPT